MQFNKKNVRIILMIIVFAMAIWAIVSNFSNIIGGIDWVFDCLFPIVLGGAFAFVINIPMRFIENKLFTEKRTQKKPIFAKIKRPISLVIALLIIIALFALIIVLVIPELVASVKTFVNSAPTFINTVKGWVNDLQARFPRLINAVNINPGDIISQIVNYLKDSISTIASSTYSIASSVAGGVLNTFLAFFFSIYVLVQKESLGHKFRKLFYAFIKKEYVDKMLRVMHLASKTFGGFVSGQCIEALYQGILFAIILSVLKVPYAVMISVIVSVCVLIPIIGAIIGCVFGGLLILTVSPFKALLYVIIFLIIMQLDSNVIYPKIMGSSVGLPSIWVLAAVTVGGNAMGIAGILLAIPTCSVIYTLLAEVVNRRLNENGIEVEFYVRHESGEKKPKKKLFRKTTISADEKEKDN